MRYKMFTIHDSKAEMYGAAGAPVIFMRSRGEFIRAFTTLVNDGQSAPSMFPADYTAFEIGEFDDSTGNVEMLVAKVSLGLALDYKNKSVGEVPPLLAAIDAAKEGK